jgi:tetratricopeptide (TPR) repeat protein
VFGFLGIFYDSLGEYEHARLVYEKLLANARRRGARKLEGSALFFLARHMQFDETDLDAVRQMFEEARQIAQEQGNTEGLIDVDMALAPLYEELGDYAQALESVARAVQVARGTGDLSDEKRRTNLATSLYEFGNLYRRRGDWKTACAASEESLVHFAYLADHKTTPADQAVTPVTFLPPRPFTPALTWETFFPQIAALARRDPTLRNAHERRWGANLLMSMGNARLHLGEGEIGRAALAMGWQITFEQNERRYHQQYLLHYALGCLEAGDYEHALHVARQVLQDAATADDRPYGATAARPYCALADVHQALYQLTEAQTALETATAVAEGIAIWERLLPVLRWCTQHGLAGEWAAAATAAREAQALRGVLPSQVTWFDFARYYETEALLRVGDRAQAEADAQRLGEQVGTNRRYRLVYLRMQALLARAAGDHAEAVREFSKALSLARELGLPGEEWQIAAELAASYSALGEVQCAQETQTKSNAIIDDLGARFTDRAMRDHFVQAARLRQPALS